VEVVNDHVGAQQVAPLLLLVAGAFLVGGCTRRAEPPPPPLDRHLFTLLPSSYTGVHFENRLRDTRDLNVFTYRN